ncbi:MAG: sodium-dependent transporter [Thermoanaerobaculia bacterium]
MSETHHATHHHPERWASRVGIILAVSGSAVGLGNFLRFPGQAAQNGGGAFMIPYFVALLLVGIPIAWAEWIMARHAGRRGFHSAPAVYGVIARSRFARYFGVLGVVVPLVVSFYYTFIEAWCLGYTWQYVTGGIGIDRAAPIAQQAAASNQFYRGYVGADSNGIMFGGSYETFVFWILVFAVNIWFVFRGLSRGIEAFVRWAMPIMAIAATVVLIRVLTLGTPDPAFPEQNVINGLAYMWNPDFAALANPQTWLAAAGQIFFSLSVGFGVIINYASYLTKKDDLVLSSLTACATNEVFEVGYGGLITLTSSFIFLGLTGTIAAVSAGTFGLGFSTLPVVFAHMGAWGNFVGAVWFFMLFLAAITSSLSMYQPALAFFQESLGISKKKATTMMVSICVFGSFLTIWFSKDGAFLGTLDDWIGTLGIFILAMFQIIIFSWIFGTKKAQAEASEGASIQIPRIFWPIMKWVTPLYLIVIFGAFCWMNLPTWIRNLGTNHVAQLALGLVGAVIVLLLVCVRIGEKRWIAAGMDINGIREPGD